MGHPPLYYAWDGKGRASGIYDGTTATAIWTGTTYNAADQPLGVPGFNGSVVMTENFTYDANTNRMHTWSANGIVNGVATNIQTGTLQWNQNGTLHTVATTDTYNPVNNNLTCTYGYDDLARLASDSCGTGWSQTITYDGYGSIIKQGNASLNVAQPYDYTNKNNHFSQSATGITYDNMGDVTKDGSGSSYNTYTYDAEGRPVTVNSVSTTFDAFNRAVEQYSLGVATQIVYAPTGEKFSFMNGQTLKSYVLPMVAGMQVVYNSTGLQYFRQVDWLGSGRFATNASGGVYYDASYGPWGESFNEQGTGDRLFTGQTQDTIAGPSQGIYDFLFRQHSPTEGRWLVPDPAGLAAVDITNPQTWNRYAYVGNNPLNSVDPQGLDPLGTVITNITVYGFDPYNIGSYYSGDFGIGGFGSGNPNRLQILPTDGPGEGRGGSRPGPGSQAQPQPQPPATNNDCGDTGFGLGVSYGGSADLGNGVLGVTSTASAGAGVFYDSNTGTSVGGFAGGGAAANAAFNSTGVPSQKGQSFSFGTFAGGGPSVFLTNAHSVQQLRGPFTTWTLNVGAGAAKFSAQLSYGGGVWQASIGPPIPVVSGGTPSVSVTKMTTKTVTTKTGCGG